MQVSGPNVGLKPQEIGGRRLRALTIALIVVVVLLVATALLAAIFDIPDFPGSDYWLSVLFIAFALLSFLLLVGPGVAFVVHTLKHRDEGVTPPLRYSATASAVVPGASGVLLTTFGETLFVIVGWVVLGLAAVVVGRAWTARQTEASAESRVLRSGYSLGGLLFVLLAASAKPHEHRPPYMTAMKSDLRNLVSAQEYYFEEHKRYTSDLAALDFKSSTGVAAPQVMVGQGWWKATTTHSKLPNVTCGIAVNTTNPVIAGVMDGEPVCK